MAGWIAPPRAARLKLCEYYLDYREHLVPSDIAILRIALFPRSRAALSATTYSAGVVASATYLSPAP
jgi:hypothetical protein